jgi:hypothetical protein
MDRWRGLKSLIVDAVEHGSRAVERVQKETARRPFEILEQIPAIQVPAKGVHQIYDLSVTGVHGMIRLVTHVVGESLDLVIDAVEKPGHDGAASGPLTQAGSQARPGPRAPSEPHKDEPKPQ